jgi:hypothetical protein
MYLKRLFWAELRLLGSSLGFAQKAKRKPKKKEEGR